MRISSKFDTRCSRCKRTIAHGTVIEYDRNAPRGQKVCCLSCADSASVPVSIPQTPRWNFEFDSVDQYLAYAGKRFSALRDHTGLERWYGAPSLKTTVEWIEMGWSDGANRVLEFAREINVEPPCNIKRHRARADQGNECDVSMYWQGRGDIAWATCRRDRMPACQHVTLIASMHGRSDLDAVTYFWRGAACLALADRLEHAGYRVTIVAEYHCRDSNNVVWVHRINVKAPENPVDVASLASVLCLAGFKRIFGFLAAARMYKGNHVEMAMGNWASILAVAHSGEIAGFDSFTDTDPNELRAQARNAVETALAKVTGAAA